MFKPFLTRSEMDERFNIHLPVREEYRSSDPVCIDGEGKYYFFNKAWDSVSGPYDSEKECGTALIEWLEGR
jgi:hypothetical protein